MSFLRKLFLHRKYKIISISFLPSLIGKIYIRFKSDQIIFHTLTFETMLKL